MIDSVKELITLLEQVPEYFGKGVLELLTFVVGGLLVGWITSKYFARRSAIVEVEGEILKRRLACFEELYAELSSLREMYHQSPATIEGCALILQQHGFEKPDTIQFESIKVFQSAKLLTDTFLKIDGYISTHRIYFNDSINDKLLIFVNYYAVYRRLLVMFEEQILQAKIPLEEENIQKAENLFVLQLALLFQDDFDEEIGKILIALSENVERVAFSKKTEIGTGASFFSHNGKVFKYLESKEIFTKREQVSQLVSFNVCLAIESYKKEKM